VNAFKSDNVQQAELINLLRKCSNVHSTLVKECSLGQGFDRHLFGLICTAKRLNRPYPRFFINNVYERMSQFILSTSTLSTDTIYFGGFGPVVPNGYGIAYNVTDEKIGFAVSAYKVLYKKKGYFCFPLLRIKGMLQNFVLN
jgi:carnitine O-palmitoyltransferase 2